MIDSHHNLSLARCCSLLHTKFVLFVCFFFVAFLVLITHHNSKRMSPTPQTYFPTQTHVGRRTRIHSYNTQQLVSEYVMLSRRQTIVWCLTFTFFVIFPFVSIFLCRCRRLYCCCCFNINNRVFWVFVVLCKWFDFQKAFAEI